MIPFRAAFLDELVKTGAPKALASTLTPESSNVRGFRYDVKEKALYVTYKSGGTYRYAGVPAGVAKSLGRNKSAGKTIHRLVKEKGYDYEKTGEDKNDLRMQIAKALLTRRMRGREVRDIAAKSIVRRGNVLSPIAGELKTKFGAGLGLAKRAWKDELPGGLADKKAPSQFDPKELAKGVKEEMAEHTNSKHIATEIVMDHLVEDPEHYEKKLANGDMLQYFADHPDKLKEKQARDKVKDRLKNFRPKGNARQRFIASRTVKTASSVVEYFSQSRRWMNKLAGVAKKQRTWDGLTMKIEQEPGDVRSGTSKDGKTWSREMHASYGYVPGTGGVGFDGEALDIYLAPEPVPGSPVFEVSQLKKDTGELDEHKYMVGWKTAADAKKAYLQHMPDWAFGSIKQVAANAGELAAALKARKVA